MAVYVPNSRARLSKEITDLAGLHHIFCRHELEERRAQTRHIYTAVPKF
jgi:hypothetical protein